jgi:hypothetical protein
MSNIKTTTLYTINTTEEQLKKNLYSSYVDILTDGLKEDTAEFFEHDAHRLSEAIQTIDKHGFASLFKEGFTVMLLDAKNFQFVDCWFNKAKFPNEEDLVVKILMKNGTTQVVNHKDLSY